MVFLSEMATRIGRMKKIAPHWQILLALVLATGTAIVFRNISHVVAEDSSAFYFIRNEHK